MVTITPQELIAVLNLTHKAPTTVGEGYAVKNVLDSLVALANQPHPIGAIEPASSDSKSPE